MKQTLVFIATLLFSLQTLADTGNRQTITRFSAGDSKASQLCLAALESRAAVKAKAKQLGISRRQLKQVTCSLPASACQEGQACSGLSLTQFAREHSNDGMRDWAIATVQ